MVGCASKKEYETTNMESFLPQSFGFDKMDLRVITSSINHHNNTMATLYGNSVAIAELKKNTVPNAVAFQPSENRERVLVLITWLQKDDPHWFGAKIPGRLRSIESLISTDVLSKQAEIRYQMYDGEELKNNSVEDGAKRINAILSMKPAVLP